MRVTRLNVENFRNLSNIEFTPDSGVNVIYGDNAQGKTNLMEAIWIFTGGRSFRGAKDNEMVKFGSDFAKLDIEFFSQQREQEAGIIISNHRKASLNKIQLSSASKLTGKFCAVVFSPVHLSLIKEGPQLRRRFIDGAVCQISPRYATIISEYNRAVVQRNALLKDVKFHSELADMLDIWEEKIAILGSKIIKQRIGYISRLQPIIKEIYSGLSRNTEDISMEYESICEGLNNSANDYSDILISQLKVSRPKDIVLSATSIGPHRDDISIKINGLSARKFGSQGQQRSCVLALKLGEVTLLNQLNDENPIVLLDDVMSELDTNRQDYILNHIMDWQVFITCCEPNAIMNLCNGKSFSMIEGVLK